MKSRSLFMILAVLLFALPFPLQALAQTGQQAEQQTKSFDISSLVAQGVPEDALYRLLNTWNRYGQYFENQQYVSLIDYRMHSSEPRFFVINMWTGQVEAHHVAHGSGSDRNHDGYADSFSNQAGSNSTSLGFFRVAETYQGKHGLSVRLDGLSKSNSNARRRAVVIHGANYVRAGAAKQGRSWGCPALNSQVAYELIPKIKNGSLLLAYF